METEFGLSIYKDHQTITVQEMPEKAPAGQLPRSVDIILDNDLVDTVKPGDRVQVVGTYRCLPGKKGGFTSGTFRCGLRGGGGEYIGVDGNGELPLSNSLQLQFGFISVLRTIMIACNVKQMSKEVSPSFSAGDIAKIRNFTRSQVSVPRSYAYFFWQRLLPRINLRPPASLKGVFEQLANSLAPSIHGHEYIKKAILCLLLGGVEKVLENGSRIRGDINILLIGTAVRWSSWRGGLEHFVFFNFLVR